MDNNLPRKYLVKGTLNVQKIIINRKKHFHCPLQYQNYVNAKQINIFLAQKM